MHTQVVCCVILHTRFCFQRLTRFFVRLLTLRCSNGHALLFQVCLIKQNNLLMKCAPGHTLSVLKPVSFVVKWRCVVSVLSPLASKSYGGSHIDIAHRVPERNAAIDNGCRRQPNAIVCKFTRRMARDKVLASGRNTSQLTPEALGFSPTVEIN